MALGARSIFVYLLLAIFLIVAAQFSLFLIGCRQDTNRANEQRQAQQLLSRDEFRQMIMGKTEDEVLTAAGRPRTTSQEAGVDYWHYADRTKDPLTGQPDSNVQVVFKQGRVVAVNY